MTATGQPVPSPATTPSPSSALRRDVVALTGCAAAVAVIVGSFGPWAQVAQFTASGIEGDGVITLVAAVVAAVGILVASMGGTRPALGSDWIAAAGATVAMFIAAYDSFEIPKTFDLLGDDVGSRTAGWGIWVTLIGTIVLVAVTVVIVIRARWRRVG